MRQTVLFAGIVCLLLSSGCLGLFSNEEIQTKLVVDVDQSTQLIETSYEQGEMISSSTATFTFDFSQTDSDVSVHTYGIDIDDGRTFAIDASEQQTISLDFERHGMYIVTAYAIDSRDIRVQELHTLVVEQVITWAEENTGNPESMFFEANPGNDGPHPSYFVLNSTVSNPAPFFEVNGQDVDLEWAVLNIDGQCLGHREIIENGDSFTWNTMHFAPVEMHEIELTIREGQDSLDVNQRLEIRYMA